MLKEKRAKRQHYIPKMILRRYSSSVETKDNRVIWQYDKKKRVERRVGIKNICCKNNLYEIRDDMGEIVQDSSNNIEKSFSFLESSWNLILRKIEKKVALTRDEIDSLCSMMVLQILRTPEILESMTKETSNRYSKYLSEQLPFHSMESYGDMISLVKNKVEARVHWNFWTVFRMAENMNLSVVHSDYPFILNSNRPVLCLRVFEKADLITYIFPFSPNYALVLNNSVKGHFYYRITDEMVKHINVENFKNDGRYVLSSRSFGEFEELSEYV